jgi:hypothetical protein
MSEDNDTGFFGVFVWVIIGLAAAFYLWGPDWNLFASDKTERWISLEKGSGASHTQGLDENWSAFTNGWLTVKGKMRKSLDTNDSRYDFAFKVNYNLTKPKLNCDLDGKIVDSYRFDFTFYFIDEDGFIIHKYSPNEYFSLEHEKHANYIEWTAKKYPYDEIEVTSAAISRHIIPEATAKRVNKIVYVPALKAVIVNRDKNKIFHDRIEQKRAEREKTENKTIKE